MPDPNELPLNALYARLAAGGLVRRLIELARDEDLGVGEGTGDLTGRVTVPETARASAAFVARQAGVAAGLATLPEVFRAFKADVELTMRVSDGEAFPRGATLATINGSKRDILAVERTSLNLLSRLCGIATLTAHYIQAAGNEAQLYDTRKTTPGLRMLEKYAVRCGGGRCHRLGLFDAVLIKDNHLAGVSTQQLGPLVAAAAQRARAENPGLSFVEVEVDSLAQFAELLRLPAGTVNIVLLDNMNPDQLREAVALRDREARGLHLEASGGIRIDTIRRIAETGIDRISVGALTHSAVAIDIGLDFDDSAARDTPA